jgi:drug/metabolite transporter, DME family
MKNNELKKGILLAICAAALNGSIGVLSKILILQNMHPAWIAFLKTILGFLIISFALVFLKKNIKTERFSILIVLLAFLGIFTLFYFETNAYKTTSAANVVILLMASSAITAYLTSWKLLGDTPGANQWVGFFLTIIGISIVLGLNSEISFYGAISAITAGIGYGLFTVLLKKNNITGGMFLTQKLLFWGGVFLLLPAVQQPIQFNIMLSKEVLFALTGLAVFPSILGFYCTTKAVQYLQPAKVQLLELSEPVFAAFFAFIVLNEAVTLSTFIGAAFVLLGIYIGAVRQSKTFNGLLLPKSSI